MPGDNLTRLEASERKALLRVDSYRIALDLTGDDQTFRSETIVSFRATPGSSTFIDFITARLHSVTLNGVDLDPAEVSDNVRIELPGLAAENTLRVVADALYTNTGEGLHRFVDPVDGEVYLYSQFEVPDSRRVFAVFEQPDLKATFQFTVTAPEHWQVVSNQPTPDPLPAGEGAATWTFAPTPVLPSYVTALVAGPYDVVRSELSSSDGRTIPLGIFSRRSLTEFLDADNILATTRAGFEFFERAFDYPYPFEKYDQLFVPEFNAGAMENAGAVTFTEAYIFRSKVTDAVRERRVITILHELAHMWFGDLVTMKWWNDLWLNESFAEYVSHLATENATEWVNTWTTFAATEKSWAYKQDQLPTTHPISAVINDLEDVQVNFDGITYAKGGSVLKQLVAWVGQEQFLAGVSNYFRKYAHANTELADLLRELEATSGRDLSDWSARWLETAGVNTLRPELEVDDAGVITSFRLVQSAPAEHPTIRPHRVAVGIYSTVDGKLVRTQRVELDVDGERTEVPELVGEDRGDLILLNDDDLAYTKIRLDATSLKTATARLRHIQSPLARALVWGAAWDATRDAENPAGDYIELVLNNIAAEDESTTLRTTLGQLSLAARQYLPEGARPTTLRRIGDALWRNARQARAGSDAQFQFVKFFAAMPSSEGHFDTIKALLDGRVHLDGLEIDTDLSWELLEGLVLGGRAGTAEIEAALAADNTATGQQAAARARAAVATPEAKLAAFTELVEHSTASNLIARAIGTGFQHVNDPACLEITVEPYFAMLNDVWHDRSYAIASSIITGLYPAPLANRQLADATRAWLDANPETPALRRLVQENLAGVERALAVQQA